MIYTKPVSQQANLFAPTEKKLDWQQTQHDDITTQSYSRFACSRAKTFAKWKTGL
jgi:hypothetical protein